MRIKSPESRVKSQKEPALQEVRSVPQFLTEGNPPQNCSLQEGSQCVGEAALHREVPCGETSPQEGNPAAGDCKPVHVASPTGEGVSRPRQDWRSKVKKFWTLDS
ncbi:hypothetical protein BZZ01_31505 [Nostocales cyanobacterium HT-58-2]|nr:hypothetical protein BZZ01_31505 [Nostocales cyanobacterium HT-58-2]